MLERGEGPLESNLLVVSLFNGIGGAFRAYDLLGIHPLGLVAVECHKPANRVTLGAWPRAIVVDDVNDVDEAMVLNWLMLFPMVSEVHVWGGFPCVHLSSARAGRKNLEGPGSNLFWKLVDILQMVYQTFSAVASVKWVVENVASIDPDARDQISSMLQVLPLRLDPADVLLYSRPRLAWISEEPTETDGSLLSRRKGLWK